MVLEILNNIETMNEEESINMQVSDISSYLQET